MQTEGKKTFRHPSPHPPATDGGFQRGNPFGSVKGKGEVLGEGRENCSEQLSLPSPKGTPS